MTFTETLSRCITVWQAEGISPGPPVSPDAIRQAWSQFGKPLSGDVISLYSTLGGFSQYEFTDDLFFSLWPWVMVRERNLEHKEGGVVFSDHSIEICTWELRYENEEVSSVWVTGDSHHIAPSVARFFEIYLEDPWMLLQMKRGAG